MQGGQDEPGGELRGIFDFRDDTLSVVDIGSNAIEGAPPYRPLVDAGLCRVTGFEPQAETTTDSAHETHLPYAVGDGSEVPFHTCAYSGWSSTLRPDARTLDVFSQYAAPASVIGETRLKTRRLDDIAEIERIDMLKIDIQGGELAVFAHGGTKLAGTLFVHTEVAYMPLYEGQPVLGDIDLALRRLGFVPHCFGGLKKAIIPPFMLGNDPWKTLNQLLDGDMVYVRDFRDLAALSPRQVKAMGLIAHACYGSWDLAYRCIHWLEASGALTTGSGERYIALVNRILGAGR